MLPVGRGSQRWNNSNRLEAYPSENFDSLISEGGRLDGATLGNARPRRLCELVKTGTGTLVANLMHNSRSRNSSDEVIRTGVDSFSRSGQQALR